MRDRLPEPNDIAIGQAIMGYMEGYNRRKKSTYSLWVILMNYFNYDYAEYPKNAISMGMRINNISRRLLANKILVTPAWVWDSDEKKNDRGYTFQRVK